jgi:FMN phosphatase YigB (HAD superfamily)
MFFKRAIDALKCTSENVVMIGDDAEADVVGAMAAGLMGVLSKQGNTAPTKRPVFPISQR